jgi:phosphonopyruvate decarboxylase
VIEAAEFLRQAAALGYRWYAGVPCSFLAALIDQASADPTVTYVSAANEGDAVAAAAGAWLGGRASVALMQNSGLGNAVSPLTSLNAVFRIPVLLIVTLRGEPGIADEPQHALMGRITPALLDTLEIPWARLPDYPEALGPALAKARAVMGETERPYVLLVGKGSFSAPAPSPGGPPPPQREPGAVPRPRWQRPGGARRPSRREALQRIAALVPERAGVLIATTGHTGRELYALGDRPHQFYLVGSMGCASSLALGLALARPALRVIVLDGDGAALMRMGNLATIGAYRPPNLVHVLLDNEAHGSTGGQATVSAGFSFASVAAACGYPSVWEGDELSLLDEALGPTQGPVFVHLKIASGTPAGLPRPSLSPVEARRRFMAHIGSLEPPCARSA